MMHLITAANAAMRLVAAAMTAVLGAVITTVIATVIVASPTMMTAMSLIAATADLAVMALAVHLAVDALMFAGGDATLMNIAAVGRYT